MLTGQISAAAGTLGTVAIYLPQFWWCVAAIPVITICNLSVSLTLALRVALRSHGIKVNDSKLNISAVLQGMRGHPRRFLYPTQTSIDKPQSEQ